MTPTETARYLSISLRTLNRWVKSNQFVVPYYRSPRQRRYDRAKIDTWVREKGVL